MFCTYDYAPVRTLSRYEIEDIRDDIRDIRYRIEDIEHDIEDEQTEHPNEETERLTELLHQKELLEDELYSKTEKLYEMRGY